MLLLSAFLLPANCANLASWSAQLPAKYLAVGHSSCFIACCNYCFSCCLLAKSKSFRANYSSNVWVHTDLQCVFESNSHPITFENCHRIIICRIFKLIMVQCRCVSMRRGVCQIKVKRFSDC